VRREVSGVDPVAGTDVEGNPPIGWRRRGDAPAEGVDDRRLPARDVATGPVVGEFVEQRYHLAAALLGPAVRIEGHDARDGAHRVVAGQPGRRVTRRRLDGAGQIPDHGPSLPAEPRTPGPQAMWVSRLQSAT